MPVDNASVATFDPLKTTSGIEKLKLYIKNMVCDRCMMSVRKELEDLGIACSSVQLGEVELPEEPTGEQLERLGEKLNSIGFELLDDKKSRIVEKIKNTIIALVHRGEEAQHLKLSALLEQKLQLDYHYLSSLFSSVEGVTIEKYFIAQRVERIKELLSYDELSLGEIADQVGYSSVQHLSQQFKKVTGFTPSAYRQLPGNQRKPLDRV